MVSSTPLSPARPLTRRCLEDPTGLEGPLEQERLQTLEIRAENRQKAIVGGFGSLHCLAVVQHGARKFALPFEGLAEAVICVRRIRVEKDGLLEDLDGFLPPALSEQTIAEEVEHHLGRSDVVSESLGEPVEAELEIGV